MTDDEDAMSAEEYVVMIARDALSAADQWLKWLEDMRGDSTKISRVMPPSETAGWGTCVSWKGNIVARVPGRKRDEIARAAAMIAAAPRVVQALHTEIAHLRTALDAVTHTHERDLLRLAKALGFEHEPPSDVDAMVAAAEAQRAIIEGRTTPPTDAEIDAHHAAGGSWLTGDTVTWAPASLHGMRDDGEAEGCVWIALDRDYRPCAWPVVTP